MASRPPRWQVIAVVAGIGAAACADVLQQRAESVLNDLMRDLPYTAEKPLRLAVNPITYGETKLTSPFLDLFHTRLEQAALSDHRIRVIERDLRKINAVMTEDKLRESGMVEGEAGALRLLPADAYLLARCLESAAELNITFELYDVDTKAKRAIVTATIPRSAVPVGMSIRPALNPVQEQVIQTANQSPAAAPVPLKLQVFPDRVGEGSVYRQGDEIRFHLVANGDCYVRVIDVQSDGQSYQIFPNQYHSDNRIRAHTDTVIPGEDHPFRFRVVPPYGAEVIIAMASAQPFDLPGIASRSVGPFAKAIINPKDIVQAFRARSARGVAAYDAEARCTVTTLPGQ